MGLDIIFLHRVSITAFLRSCQLSTLRLSTLFHQVPNIVSSPSHSVGCCFCCAALRPAINSLRISGAILAWPCVRSKSSSASLWSSEIASLYFRENSSRHLCQITGSLILAGTLSPARENPAREVRSSPALAAAGSTLRNFKKSVYFFSKHGKKLKTEEKLTFNKSVDNLTG